MAQVTENTTGGAKVAAIGARLGALIARGVEIIDPRQTYVGPEVDPQRIAPGVILHPGTRLGGARTLLSPGAEVGSEGPATVIDAVLGEGAAIASGYVDGAVLLRGARVGANAHIRPGTLLEEEASTAHAVGLKHTILLAFVTLGSLINFCDALIAGGTSRRDHSEVGSGYIHFNYTPWGATGDKATPSLIGEVPRGVLLRERRIFLGGSAGMVGPRRVGFGAVVGAGSLLRADVADGTLVLQRGRDLQRPVDPTHLDPLEARYSRNLRYIGELIALRAWYREVRRPRVAAGFEAQVVEAAIGTLELAITERRRRLDAFARERGRARPLDLDLDAYPACPLGPQEPPEELPERAPEERGHIAWVQALGDGEAEVLRRWLAGIVDAVANDPG